jgi:ferredoxin-NADP reductase
MSADDLERALQVLVKRRPFTTYLIELNSGDRISVSHPEAVYRYGDLFVYRGPDRSHRIFAAVGVCQLIDPPKTGPVG